VPEQYIHARENTPISFRRCEVKRLDLDGLVKPPDFDPDYLDQTSTLVP